MEPKTYAAHDMLRDGSPVWVRTIRPDDQLRLAQFHGRLSPESVYLRYFELKPVLSDRRTRRCSSWSRVRASRCTAPWTKGLFA